MDEGRRNVMVGFFVLTGLAMLGTLIVLFGQGPSWLTRGRSYELHINLAEAAGVREGNPVVVKGVNIGEVVAVKLKDEKDLGAPVRVTIAVQSTYTIVSGSRAIATEPVLGQGRPPIEILPGPSGNPALPPGAELKGEVRGGLASIVPPELLASMERSATQIGDAAEALAPVLRDMHEMLQPRDPAQVDALNGPPGNLSSAAARFDQTVRHMNDVLGDPAVKSQLREGIANFNAMSADGKLIAADLRTAASDAKQLVADGKTFMTNANTSLTKLDGQIDTVARATVGNLEKLSKFLDHMNVAGQQISSGEGTIGLLVKDGRLYESMVLTAERLAATVGEFRELIQQWKQGKIKVGL